MESGSAFPHPEGTLPGRLGIPRGVLRVLRDQVLEEGVDWALIHKEVRLTAAAVARVLEAYGRLKNGGAVSREGNGGKVAVIEPGEAVDVERLKAKGQRLNAETSPDGIGISPSAFSLQPLAFPVAEELVVSGAAWNPKLLEAIVSGRLPLAPHPERVVFVRVRETGNFIVGMRIYGVRVSGGLYEYHGRYPRWRGEAVYREAVKKG